MSAIYLNALGMLTALGNAPQTLAGLRAESAAGLQWRDDLRATPVRVAAVDAELPSMDAWPTASRSRNNRLLAAALVQVQATLDEMIDRYGAGRIGAVVGSSTSGILEGGIAAREKIRSGEFPRDFDYAQQEIGAPSTFLRTVTGIRGPAFTVSTACTSGAKALAAAARLLRHGICDAVLAGGVDSLCPLTVSGFSSLESVAAERCNPFSRNRDGITIGEGAALFLVSREPAATRLAGTGESSDAYHISAPDPEGRGAEAAIRAALENAKLAAGAIDYINLHGTATPKNDLMESRVVNRVFGENTPASSTKPLLGHTLGAAGAIEAGICWQLLQDGGALPPHSWDGEADPDCAPLALCEGNAVTTPRHAISNSFAFGGSNAVVILGRE